MTFLTEAIFAHPPTKTAFSEQAFIRAMIRVEAALARAQETLGMIPAKTAEAIEAAQITGDTLTAGVRDAGVPVPAFLAELRAVMPKEAADWVHYGATSQDIVDTALSLCLAEALKGHAVALGRVIDALAAKAEEHRGLPMLGRTRGQFATPISFSLRVANWAAPLISLEAEMSSVRRQALRVQMGGSAGSNYAVAPHGPDITATMAAELGLFDAVPWHTDRGGFTALAGWALRLVAALAKIGADLALASRGEVAEMKAGRGGGSSTMPHKVNPVTTEALQSCFPAAASAHAGLIQAAVHAEERDGAPWAVDWKLLPELMELTGAALAHATLLVETLEPNAAPMAARIEQNPAVMAEAYVFALAATYGRQHATKAVKDALTSGEPLKEALMATLPEADLDSIPTVEHLTLIADDAADRVIAGRRKSGAN